MTVSGTTCTVDLPSDKAGDLFYYLEIQADGQTLTKPYDKRHPSRFLWMTAASWASPARSP